MRCYIILIVFLLSGCGARKVDKQTAIENSSLNLKQTASYDITAETLKNVDVKTSEYEWSAEPVNPDKEMEFTGPDGKPYKGKNTKFTGKKKQEQSKTTEQKKVEAKGKSQTDLNKNKKTKVKAAKIDREAVFPLHIVICALLLLAFVIWLIWWLRRQKKKVPII